MKNLLYISSSLFLSATMLGSCAGEEDDIFDSSAAVRMEQAAEQYTQLLQSSPGGWVMQYYPTNATALTTGQGYLWLLKFNNDLSVNVATQNMFTNNAYSEALSAWEVISDNGPVLSFNTYNPNIHIFSDPDLSSIPNSSENVWGVGVGGDYEFVIVDTAEDQSYVMLKGKKRGTYNLMTRLPEGTDFQEYLADIKAFNTRLFPNNAINSLVVQMGDTSFVASELNSTIAQWYPLGGDAITETTAHPFVVSKQGDEYRLRFRETFKFDGSDEEYKEFVYDADKDIFVGLNGVNATIKGVNASTFLDQWMTQQAHKWNVPLTDMHSDDFVAAVNQVSADMASLPAKYKLAGIRLKRVRRDYSDGTREMVYVAEFTVTYTTRRMGKTVTVTANLDYQYDYEATEIGLTLNYKEPIDDGAVNTLATVPSLQTVLNLLSGTFNVSGYTTNFVLNTLRLTNASNNLNIVVTSEL